MTRSAPAMGLPERCAPRDARARWSCDRGRHAQSRQPTLRNPGTRDHRSVLHQLGPALATHPRFPEGTNVELAEVVTPSRIQMLVWERGVGPTESSGTGTCAAAVAAITFGGAARDAEVVAPGVALQRRMDQRRPVLDRAGRRRSGPTSTGWTARRTLSVRARGRRQSQGSARLAGRSSVSHIPRRSLSPLLSERVAKFQTQGAAFSGPGARAG